MIAAVTFIFGSMIGSFLNVCIYRMPRGISVVLPRSHCPHCKKNIPFYLNVPILSWIILFGKTSCCNKSLSIMYPLIECFTGILAVTSLIMFSPKVAVAMFIFLCLMIVAFFIDLKFMIIPDEISVVGAILGMMLSFTIPEIHAKSSMLASLIESVSGALTGTGLLLWIALLAEILLKKEAMGMGDIKLIGCIGSFLGFDGCIFSIFAGATLGTVTFLPIILLNKLGFLNKTKISLGAQIPFGPFLSAGSAIYVLYAKNYFSEYIYSIKSVILAY